MNNIENEKELFEIGKNLKIKISDLWKEENLVNINKGVIYIENSRIQQKEVCPGVFGTIKNQGICMVGRK